MRLPVLAFILPLFCVAAEIPQGSHVLLKMVNSVTTRTAKEGRLRLHAVGHPDRFGRPGSCAPAAMP